MSRWRAVKKGTTSTNKAAKLYNVPCTSLKDRLSGKVIHGTKPGPQRYLNQEEEAALAEHLIEAARIGYGKTRREVKAITEEVAIEKNILRKNHVTDGWWRRFLERQPKLSLRRGDATAHVRMDSVNGEAIKAYYDLLNETLQEHDLSNHPAQIYNMDESGMPLDPRPPNVIARRGQKKVRYRVSGKKEQITILGCANAIGQALPPMVIFEGKYLNYQWTSKEVPGTYYGMSGKGWTDQELFRHWLKNHFLKYAVPGRPLLLLMDGHSSHYQPASVDLAKDNDIILFCLPPHTTQDSQPLDCTVFGPLKRHWSTVCHNYLQENPGIVLSKYNFSEVFSEAWLLALTPANNIYIVSGFRKCGIYPFNRDAIPILSSGSKENNGTGLPPDKTSTSASCGGSTDPPNETDPDDEQNGHSTSSPTSTPSDFSEEQIELFERRYEEGYDLYVDKQYVAWLELNHPGVVPREHLTCGSNSVLDAFSYVSSLDPVDDSESPTPPDSSSSNPLCPANTQVADNAEPPSGPSPVVTTPAAVTAVLPSGSGPSTSCVTPTTTRSVSKPAKKVSPVDKYLTLPATIETPKRPSSSRAMTGARVLTSAQCLAIIKEKERKKRKEEEEKEERKRIREMKKQQREDERKKKLELKALREQEKKRKDSEKEEAKKKKAEERARVSTQTKKRRRCEEAGPSSATSDTGPSRTNLRSRHDEAGPSSKAPRMEDVIVSDQCCVCYQAFDEDVQIGAGIDWVQCVCTRWLHEDCVIDCVIDESGKEKLLPSVVS